MSFGALGFFGATNQNALRSVVLSGGTTFNLGLFYVDDVQGYKQTLLDKFSNDGWIIDELTLIQNGNTNTIGIRIACKAYSQYSADTIRRNAINVFESVTQGYLIKDKLFSNTYMQIVSDGTKKVSPDVSQAAAKSKPSQTLLGAQNIKDAAALTADQIADKGAAGIGLDGLNTLLFGANNNKFELLGASIPKIAVVGVLAVVVAPTVINRLQGRR